MENSIKEVIVKHVAHQLEGERKFSDTMNMTDAQIADCAIDCADEIVKELNGEPTELDK